MMGMRGGGNGGSLSLVNYFSVDSSVKAACLKYDAVRCQFEKKSPSSG